ncbi:hypothetical protein ACFY1U_29350 [Streptomyces sp. NPDC001351]|uniref:hypothetical protein n=1 Tax=Streptomyces sp. NPDC001351 TaxID=3364564 RepID=UPI0036A27EE8
MSRNSAAVTRQKRALTLALSAGLVLAGQLAFGPGAAYAASASACAANPSKNNCDHVDPTDGNRVCMRNTWEVSGYPVVPKYDVNYGGKPVPVRVELWWSETCKSNWARVVSTGYSGRAEVSVWRKSDGKADQYTHDMTASGTWSALYTNLMYAASPDQADACAQDQSTWGGCGPYK